MKYLNNDGTIDSRRLTITLRQLAININDSIYYCFDELSNEKRLLALEVYNGLLNLSKEIEREENEFFNT